MSNVLPALNVRIFDPKTLTWWRSRKSKIDMEPTYQRRGRLLDGAGLFLRLVARWNFCLTELHSRHGVA
jgi:hypothetical protein